MSDTSLSAYRAISTSEQRTAFRQAMKVRGYSAFYAFAEDIRQVLKSYDESEIEAVGEMLRRGRDDFPQPQRFSPSWAELWEEYDRIYAIKNETMVDVPASDRDGEWQVLIDNPYMPHQVVCYPGLTFVDAAYTYAYFQKELKPNEILRLQKVSHVHVTSGRKEASMLPDA